MDTVGPAYGKDALAGLLELMGELETRGLLVRAPFDSGKKPCEAKATDAGAIEARSGHFRVYVCVTDNCNLTCATCYRGAGGDDAPTEAVIETISKMAAFHPAELVITGGEPTLRADLTDLLRVATQVAPSVTLATNATLITESMAEAIASLGVRVQVSVDSADRAEHDVVRGEGSFGRLFKV